MGEWSCETWFLHGYFVRRGVHAHSWLIPVLNLSLFPVITPSLERPESVNSDLSFYTPEIRKPKLILAFLYK